MDFGNEGDREGDFWEVSGKNRNLPQEANAGGNLVQMPVIRLPKSEPGADQELSQVQQPPRYARLMYQADDKLLETIGNQCSPKKTQQYRNVNAHSAINTQSGYQSSTPQYHTGNQFQTPQSYDIYQNAQATSPYYHSALHLKCDHHYSNPHQASRNATQQNQMPQQLQSQVNQKLPETQSVQQSAEELHSEELQQHYNAYNNSIIPDSDSNAVRCDAMNPLSQRPSGDFFLPQKSHTLSPDTEHALEQLSQQTGLQMPADSLHQIIDQHIHPTLQHTSSRKQFYPQQARPQEFQTDPGIQKLTRDHPVTQSSPSAPTQFQPRTVPAGGGLLEEVNHEVPGGPLTISFMKKKVSQVSITLSFGN